MLNRDPASSVISLALSFVLALAFCTAARAADLERVDVAHDGVAARAVGTPAGATLAHTAQVFPHDANGRIAGADAAAQAETALTNLAALLATAGASLDSAARVNLYAATPQAAVDARRVLDTRLKCAVTTVVSALPKPGVLVALDAVAVSVADPPPDRPSDPTRVRLLRPAGAAYVSGMAAKGATLADATRDTLAQLDGVLKHLKLARADVVHVKAFARGMDGVAAARAELARFFDGKPPPATWVEWTMNAPVEIELVAATPGRIAADGATADGARPGDTATYLNPPPGKASPLYSRVVLVHGGRMIYTSGPYAPEGTTDATAETRLLLAARRAAVTRAGGDFDHLVKATYYPATDATSAALNKVRPEFLNPQRPPAASKAPARHVGAVGRQLTLDLIAVTPR